MQTGYLGIPMSDKREVGSGRKRLLIALRAVGDTRQQIY